MKFDLQLFCGGSKSTTVQNNYRPLTADELRMQKLSTDYAEKIQPSAYQMYQQGMNGINNAINPAPDYSNLYHQQASQTAQNGQTASNIANGILPQQMLWFAIPYVLQFEKSARLSLTSESVH